MSRSGGTRRWLHLFDLGHGRGAVWHPLTLGIALGPIEELRRVIDAQACDRISGDQASLRADLFPGDESARAILEEYRESVAQTSGIRMGCLFLTYDCTHRCGYCFLGSLREGGPTMEKVEVQRAIDSFLHSSRKSSGRDLLLYGGEPGLHPELIRETLRSLGAGLRSGAAPVNLILSTSGTGASEELASQLALADCFVILSIDGPPEVHDSARPLAAGGESSFRVAEQAFETYRAAGCRVGISVTVSKHNIERLQESFVWLAQRFAPDDMGLNSALHPCVVSGAPSPLQVPASIATPAMLGCLEWARSRRGLYVEQLFRRLRPFVSMVPRLRDCASAGGRLVFAPGGEVGLCDCLAAAGEFLSPGDSAREPGGMIGYRDFSSLSPVNWEECLDCPALCLCGGGCRYDAWCESGSIRGRSADRCEQELLLLDWMIRDLDSICRKRYGDGGVVVPSPSDRQTMFGLVDVEDLRAVPMPCSTRFGEERPGGER